MNFRNFRQANIELPAGVSVLHGDNGHGKTALLEAVYTLAIGRAFRADREREVLNFEAAKSGEAAYITGIAHDDGGNFTVVVGYEPTTDDAAGVIPNGRRTGSVVKRIRVNRQPTTASGLVGRIGATLFVVDDLEMVLGPPSHRRRYLDVLISQSCRAYLEGLRRYQAALRNRNGLLRRQRHADVEPDEMEYWDDQLATTGSRITLARAGAIALLRELAQGYHGELATPDQTLGMEYRPNVPAAESAEAIEAEFRHRLKQRSGREYATGVTSTGPHRDDFGISVNGIDAHSYASRGQARTIAVALRLAEADYLAQSRGDDPVILLDDVFSEMDGRRRERVLRRIQAYRQALVTTTDVDMVRSVLGEGAAYFSVVDGTVRREG